MSNDIEREAFEKWFGSRVWPTTMQHRLVTRHGCLLAGKPPEPSRVRLASEIVRQGERHKVEDFDSELNWLARCVADARDAVDRAQRLRGGISDE